ncbi:hypothetical protein AVEN_127529-1 [Araneus ventricosus]|uniref:F-box domain-containing protein n=1 Tax=Araneus ventricosus TaxID=182803 RepID=A0A4Y2T845_ARAVE|nr:hypothetical protein AVEN_34178-1 [Araneus ventricosus]GBN95265.1 hypothetical protein AVEN_127529-1 [Araneus ventricosus]
MGGCLSTQKDPISRSYLIDEGLTKTIESNEKDECEKQGKWSELPSLPLEKIYSFLRREDQVRMSLVSRSWSEGYGSPSVWKTFGFYLTESQLSLDTCPVMKFAQKYSNMFRHVEIESTYTHDCLRKIWCRHFVEFLKILTTKAQLTSVKFLYFANFLWRLDKPTYNNICSEIVDFLASQRHLKRVEFDLCFFNFQECVEILRKLTENSGESLTHLKLLNFLRDKNKDIEKDSNAAKKLLMLADLPSLRTLETDYSFIFENIVPRQSTAIQTGKNCKTPVLSKLILYYFNEYTKIEDFRGLTSTDWRFMKRMYPDLQVELILTTDSATRRELEFFIMPNMPITRLDYMDERCEESDWGIDIAELFGHLLACKTNDHLVTLHLDWKKPIQHLSLTFNPFLQACKKLKCLEVTIYSPSSGIDVLLESWLENRPESLKKVIIHVSCIDVEDDFPSLLNLTTEYVSLLKRAGLNICVHLYNHRII